MKVIGLDVGNGSIAMYIRSEDGVVVTDTYSSVYGAYYRDTQDVSLNQTKVSKGARAKTVDVFTFEKRDYVLGYENVDAIGSTPISAYDREQRIGRREFQTLSKLALLDAATKDGNTGIIEVVLGFGTPAEDYRDEIIAELKRWFGEPVVGSKNGQQVVVMVKYLEIVSQPIAVLMDAYLDNDGFNTDESLQESDVLVIDSGSGTLDMSEFHGTTLMKQVSEPVGMNDVYAYVIREIEKKEPKARVDAYDLESQLRLQDGQPEFKYKYGRLSIDVTDMRKMGMDFTWERMVGAVTRRFPDRLKFHRVLLAGGTGEAFQSYFKDWMSNIELLEDPQLAISRGLGKYVLASSQEPVENV